MATHEMHAANCAVETDNEATKPESPSTGDELPRKAVARAMQDKNDDDIAEGASNEEASNDDPEYDNEYPTTTAMTPSCCLALPDCCTSALPDFRSVAVPNDRHAEAVTIGTFGDITSTRQRPGTARTTPQIRLLNAEIETVPKHTRNEIEIARNDLEYDGSHDTEQTVESTFVSPDPKPNFDDLETYRSLTRLDPALRCETNLQSAFDLQSCNAAKTYNQEAGGSYDANDYETDYEQPAAPPTESIDIYEYSNPVRVRVGILYGYGGDYAYEYEADYEQTTSRPPTESTDIREDSNLRPPEETNKPELNETRAGYGGDYAYEYEADYEQTTPRPLTESTDIREDSNMRPPEETNKPELNDAA